MVLRLGVSLPASAIPDVVDLYTSWSVGLVGTGSSTPVLVPWFHYWLTEIETASESVSFEDRRRPFNGELTSEQIGKLAEDLRTGFLLFCNHTPHACRRLFAIPQKAQIQRSSAARNSQVPRWARTGGTKGTCGAHRRTPPAERRCGRRRLRRTIAGTVRICRFGFYSGIARAGSFL